MGDYDRKPKESTGIFLRLKSKEERCRLRIAAPPLREPQIWIEGERAPMKPEKVLALRPGQWATIMREPKYRVGEVYHFIVIDRMDGIAKIFTTTGGVYGKIREFATNEEWGDPKLYDLTITRTEQPGKNYYEVTPSPNKSDLTPYETDIAGKLWERIKNENILPAATLASEPQPDDINENTEPEPLTTDGYAYPDAQRTESSFGDEPLDMPDELPPE
jgi:hypothetical protein